MEYWILFAIFLSSPQGFTETYLTKQTCLQELHAFKALAQKDFYAGVCRNAQDEEDYVEVTTELAP